MYLFGICLAIESYVLSFCGTGSYHFIRLTFCLEQVANRSNFYEFFLDEFLQFILTLYSVNLHLRFESFSSLMYGDQRGSVHYATDVIQFFPNTLLIWVRSPIPATIRAQIRSDSTLNLVWSFILSWAFVSQITIITFAAGKWYTVQSMTLTLTSSTCFISFELTYWFSLHTIVDNNDTIVSPYSVCYQNATQ